MYFVSFLYFILFKFVFGISIIITVSAISRLIRCYPVSSGSRRAERNHRLTQSHWQLFHRNLNPGSGERQHSVSGIAIDHSALNILN